MSRYGSFAPTHAHIDWYSYMYMYISLQTCHCTVRMYLKIILTMISNMMCISFSGWHRRLNSRAGVAPPFYLLVRLLGDEAKIALNNVSLVTELQLTRYQRKQYRTMQSQIIDMWNRYGRGEVSATGLLKQISTKYKPSVSKE